jgi:hypothetical protein
MHKRPYRLAKLPCRRFGQLRLCRQQATAKAGAAGDAIKGGMGHDLTCHYECLPVCPYFRMPWCQQRQV